MPNPNELVSHGRGGAANIRKDDTPYVDGNIVRKGVQGDQGDGPFSTGRGGQANIGGVQSPRLKPADQEEIPDSAIKAPKDRSHHTGRGGAGNEQHVHEQKKEHHHRGLELGEEGLADKLKHKIFGEESSKEAGKP